MILLFSLASFLSSLVCLVAEKSFGKKKKELKISKRKSEIERSEEIVRLVWLSY